MKSRLLLSLRAAVVLTATCLAVLPLMGGCVKDGDDGAQGLPGQPGQPGSTVVASPTDVGLELGEDMPGLVLDITGVSGGTGTGGNFLSGDKIAVTFTIKKKDGSSFSLSEVDSTAIWVAGPTSNYQHIIPSGNSFSLSDIKTAAVQNSDGSYTYTIQTALPVNYGAPFYDTSKFTDGELTGQALLSGTYTVAMRMYKNYTETTGVSYRDVGWDTFDFLFGTATTIESREVVKDTNCNQCHAQIQMHGGTYRSTKLCVTCHTSGAEDRYSDTMGVGDTTNVTIDFRVMIHKLHNAAHLPSVLGVGTNPATAQRVYTATPTPFKVGGSGYAGSTTYDFSEIAFPVWPNLSYALPRNKGYSSLSTTDKSTDDKIRTGAADCSKCHGDPDGSGSLTAPAQGSLAYAQPSRRVCGSCHDDIDWDLNVGGYCFIKNDTNGHPTQLNDSGCTTCHLPTGNNLAVTEGHLHPLKNPTYNPGLNATISAITPSAGSTLDPGEKLAFTFDIKNDANAAINPSTNASSLYFVLAGPTTNRNLLLYTSISSKVLGTGAGPYTMNVPQPVSLEYAGNAAGVGTPHLLLNTPMWSSSDASTVYEVTAYGGVGKGDTTLSAAGAVGDDYVTVTSITDFHKGDYVVIDRGAGGEEYLQLAAVDGATNRLYFTGTTNYSTMSRVVLRNAHLALATIREVTLTTRTVTTQYTITASPATITEVAGFTAGNAIIVSYTIDWVTPSTYKAPYGDSADLGDDWGDWGGKDIVDGTYTLGFWAAKSSISVTFPPSGEATSYTAPSLMASGGDFLVGTATEIEPYALISSANNCTVCHDQPQFHGGSRRGADTCLICHAQAGAEDGPRRVWVQANASPAVDSLATTGVTINYRTMLHKIHKGKDMFYADTYAVVGNGGTAHYYDEVGFPAMPNGVKHCDKCHGTSNSAWEEPEDRTHPTNQTMPLRRWRAVCLACHDSPDVQGHYDLMTSGSGYESCGACHDPGSVYSVKVVHKNR
ncbi:MAG: hypothetical protein HYY16_01875 [Planctomycetes bacterium]|nr:hypothetical protein [Planctomycetota bacterium]